jgi:hypothetical protein
MTTSERCRFFVNRCAGTLLLASACCFASATEFSGRGIYDIASDSGCPFSPAASSGCNRVALDDGLTRASIDPATKTIKFQNTNTYDDKATVGDLLLQGTGEGRNGKRVPISFHLVLGKDGGEWTTNAHVHAPVKGSFRNVRIDEYTVQASAQGVTRTVMTPAQMHKLLNRPELVARLASNLVEVRDNRSNAGQSPDITIALGRGKLAASVMRARLQAVPDSAGMDAMLEQGTWAVELEALTGHLPEHVIQRELFLYQLDQLPLLQPVVQAGFKKHQKLVLGAVNGKGYIRFDGKQQDFADAPRAARSFLQQSFVGLILETQQIARSASLAH